MEAQSPVLNWERKFQAGKAIPWDRRSPSYARRTWLGARNIKRGPSPARMEVCRRSQGDGPFRGPAETAPERERPRSRQAVWETF